MMKLWISRETWLQLMSRISNIIRDDIYTCLGWTRKKTFNWEPRVKVCINMTLWFLRISKLIHPIKLSTILQKKLKYTARYENEHIRRGMGSLSDLIILNHTICEVWWMMYNFLNQNYSWTRRLNHPNRNILLW